MIDISDIIQAIGFITVELITGDTKVKIQIGQEQQQEPKKLPPAKPKPIESAIEVSAEEVQPVPKKTTARRRTRKV